MIQEIDPKICVPGGYEFLSQVEGSRCFSLPEGLQMEERAENLGLNLERVAVTLYVQGAKYQETHVFGAVYPAARRINWRMLHSAIRNSGAMLRRKDIRLAKQEYLPTAMGPGSCGPFLCEKDIECSAVGRIFIDEDYFPRDLEEVVDFAPPGHPSVSYQVPFSVLMRELEQRGSSFYEWKPLTKAKEGRGCR